MYAKVSKKGQVTIPKLVRQKLNVEKEGAVLFLVEENEVKLKGVPGAQVNRLAGSLKKYARKYVPLGKARETIKEQIANEAAKEDLPA